MKETKQPGAAVVRQMLDDMEAVTKSRFYEDPDPVSSPVEMFRLPHGEPGGEPFDALSVREKIQVLGDYTDWQGYENGGIESEQIDRVFVNAIEGKPREKWLEGTGLTVPQRQRQPQPGRARDRQIEPGE